MPTIRALARHLDMSADAMSKFLHREGLDWNKTTEEQVRFAYIRRLREQAAGHGASTATGAINIVEERARLAHHQANIAELEEATRRGALPRTGRVGKHWGSRRLTL